MTPSRVSTLCGIAALALVATPLAGTAYAQLGPGQPGGKPIASESEGIAEEAPEEAEAKLPTTPVLPVPKAEEKEFERFLLNGYFRLRGDWFKNFDLGFSDDPTVGGAPFPNPLACHATTAGAPCEHTLKSGNMRLHVSPIIYIDERTSIHADIDVLDNVVLGSTPRRFVGPDIATGDEPTPGDIGVGTDGSDQVSPQTGRNYLYDSIRVKHVWGEVMTPLGLLKFGRMADNWGLGILANGGSYDELHDTYDLDSDFGDTVDRVMFSRSIPGTGFNFAIGMDWASTEPVAAQTDEFLARFQGQPFDLDDNDDVNQWTFVVSHIDDTATFRDIVDRGEVALNYGLRFAYQSQSWAQTGTDIGEAPPADRFVPRNAKAYIPDVWGRLAFGDLEIEAEGVAVLGSIDDVSDLPGGEDDSIDLSQFGAVARLSYWFLDRDMKLGVELGYASGDQWDNTPQGAIHESNAPVLPGPGDTSLSAFFFDRDYNIDLILFRELFGAVTNATYIKPSLDYQFSDFEIGGAGILSFANQPVSTPGNASMYGFELDAHFGYQNDGFFAGIAYGLLVPLAALDHPGDNALNGGSGFGYGSNIGDADTAQTIQTRLVLQF